MIRVPALITLLVWATFTFPVHAQNPTGTSGGARLDPTEQVDGPVFVEGDAAVVTSDTLNERILYLASGQAWALDLHTGRWQHLQPLQLPEGVAEGAYDGARDELVLWSRGVGEVYTWQDGDEAPARIDRSFPHRTQYGHLGLYDAAAGHVYAFGGYGFWYYRNYTARFGRTTREWTLQPYADGPPVPVERANAVGAFSPSRRAFYVVGGAALEGGRAEPYSDAPVAARDAWRFDLRTNRWVLLRADLPFPSGVGRSGLWGNVNSAAAAALDDEAGLLFFVLAHEAGAAARHVYALDVETGATYRAARLWQAPIEPLGLVWDAPRGRLVLLGLHTSGAGGTHPVTAWQVEGPFGPGASTSLDGGPDEAEASPLAALAVLVGGGIFTALLLFLYWQMRRSESGAGPILDLPTPEPSRSPTPPPPAPAAARPREAHIPPASGSPASGSPANVSTERPGPPARRPDEQAHGALRDGAESPGPASGLGRLAPGPDATGAPPLLITPDSPPEVRIGDEPLDCGAVERELLLLLAKARTAGRRFVPAEDLDDALFSGYDNLDYVRKMRNQTIRRLAELLGAHFAPAKDVVVRRRARDDRRRVEYALSERVVLRFVRDSGGTGDHPGGVG